MLPKQPSCFIVCFLHNILLKFVNDCFHPAAVKVAKPENGGKDCSKHDVGEAGSAVVAGNVGIGKVWEWEDVDEEDNCDLDGGQFGQLKYYIIIKN